MAKELSQRKELQDRVHAKRKEIEARLVKERANARSQGRETQKRLEQKLEEVNTLLKNGWEDLTEGAAEKLNNWLKD